MKDLSLGEEDGGRRGWRRSPFCTSPSCRRPWGRGSHAATRGHTRGAWRESCETVSAIALTTPAPCPGRARVGGKDPLSRWTPAGTLKQGPCG